MDGTAGADRSAHDDDDATESDAVKGIQSVPQDADDAPLDADDTPLDKENGSDLAAEDRTTENDDEDAPGDEDGDDSTPVSEDARERKGAAATETDGTDQDVRTSATKSGKPTRDSSAQTWLEQLLKTAPKTLEVAPFPLAKLAATRDALLEMMGGPPARLPTAHMVAAAHVALGRTAAVAAAAPWSPTALTTAADLVRALDAAPVAVVYVDAADGGVPADGTPSPATHVVVATPGVIYAAAVGGDPAMSAAAVATLQDPNILKVGTRLARSAAPTRSRYFVSPPRRGGFDVPLACASIGRPSEPDAASLPGRLPGQRPRRRSGRQHTLWCVVKHTSV